MYRPTRTLGLLFILAVVTVPKLAAELYRWYAYADEREQLHEMRDSVEVVALEVARTRLELDSLRRDIEGRDGELEEARRRLVEFRAAARRDGTGDSGDAYRRNLVAYNRGVRERNARLTTLQRVLLRNRRAVREFNDLADSMRAVGGRIGEPYLHVPTPGEVAVERGLVKF